LDALDEDAVNRYVDQAVALRGDAEGGVRTRIVEIASVFRGRLIDASPTR
jgi:hypothetical protein